MLDVKVAGVENRAGLPSQPFWLKCAQVRKSALSKVLLFRRHRLPAQDLIAVRVTAKCCNDLADVFGLFHQGSIDRLQVFRGGGSNFSPQTDEEINALKVVGALPVTEWLGVGDLEPGCHKGLKVPVLQTVHGQRQGCGIMRKYPGRASPE
ncbi:hypothetical protein IL54_4619 [Sphingobium sp. ba1]|nr:hypothetical protein IL54_4619 [Sphingobium sp. ba1]